MDFLKAMECMEYVGENWDEENSDFRYSKIIQHDSIIG